MRLQKLQTRRVVTFALSLLMAVLSQAPLMAAEPGKFFVDLVA
ncbi:MAG TPA: hypothetical protein VMI72_11640 [Roseiarcus sp.]|nr:hypothetical protein [Roseiarcus sp.]